MPSRLTASCRELLLKMIEVNPDQRYTTLDCLSHAWIKGGEAIRLEQ